MDRNASAVADVRQCSNAAVDLDVRSGLRGDRVALDDQGRCAVNEIPLSLNARILAQIPEPPKVNTLTARLISIQTETGDDAKTVFGGGIGGFRRQSTG